MTYLTRLITLIFFATAMTFATPTYANKSPIVVVVNKDNPTEKMNRSQVIDLFMGKYVAFPDGSKAFPIDLQGDKEIKKNFYLELVGQSLARVNAYWSRIKFTGRTKPSLKKDNTSEIIEFISNNKNGIGYIPKNELNENLKVVYQFDD